MMSCSEQQEIFYLHEHLLPISLSALMQRSGPMLFSELPKWLIIRKCYLTALKH